MGNENPKEESFLLKDVNNQEYVIPTVTVPTLDEIKLIEDIQKPEWAVPLRNFYIFSLFPLTPIFFIAYVYSGDSTSFSMFLSKMVIIFLPVSIITAIIISFSKKMNTLKEFAMVAPFGFVIFSFFLLFI